MPIRRPRRTRAALQADLRADLARAALPPLLDLPISEAIRALSVPEPDSGERARIAVRAIHFRLWHLPVRDRVHVAAALPSLAEAGRSGALRATDLYDLWRSARQALQGRAAAAQAQDQIALLSLLRRWWADARDARAEADRLRAMRRRPIPPLPPSIPLIPGTLPALSGSDPDPPGARLLLALLWPVPPSPLPAPDLRALHAAAALMSGRADEARALLGDDADARRAWLSRLIAGTSERDPAPGDPAPCGCPDVPSPCPDADPRRPEGPLKRYYGISDDCYDSQEWLCLSCGQFWSRHRQSMGNRFDWRWERSRWDAVASPGAWDFGWIAAHPGAEHFVSRARVVAWVRGLHRAEDVSTFP